MLILSGDASGDLVVSELAYNNNHQKLEAVDLLYRRKAHKAGVVQIELCNQEDVFVTISQDASIV